MRRFRWLFVFVVGSLAIAATFVGFARSDEPEPTAKLAFIDRPSHMPLDARASVDVGGEQWTLGTFKNTSNQLCLEGQLPGVGLSRSCLDPTTLFAEGRDIIAMPGASQISSPAPQLHWSKVWIYGFVSPAVARLTLVSLDCSEVEVPFDEGGAFLHVVAPADVARGVLPYKMVAQASDGSDVETRNVSLGLPANAKRAGVKAPQPAAGCP
jgi:hypothetical protein